MSDTVHMNIPACEEAKTLMTNAKQAIEEQMTSVAGRVESMVGSDWISTGAEQFRTDVQDWRTQVTNALTRLEELATAFQGEIDRMRAEEGSYTS